MRNNFTCRGHSLHAIAVFWIPAILAEIEGNAVLNMFACLFLTQMIFTMTSGSSVVKITEYDNSQDLEGPLSLKFLIVKVTSENEEIMKINTWWVKRSWQYCSNQRGLICRLLVEVDNICRTSCNKLSWRSREFKTKSPNPLLLSNSE